MSVTCIIDYFNINFGANYSLDMLKRRKKKRTLKKTEGKKISKGKFFPTPNLAYRSPNTVKLLKASGSQFVSNN